ncbi:MAG: 50S ribosomal protein L6 [Armatimonadetes bacterium]|nr:50S ribosomal protein L6 [Armatimonadota bacterium]
MSRIGRKPIPVPAGVDVQIGDGTVTVKGPGGTLSHDVPPPITVRRENGKVLVDRPSDEKRDRSLHGLTRTLIANMVEGVTSGFSRTLELTGVGYRAQKVSETRITLQLGFSHPVDIMARKGIAFDVEQLGGGMHRITVKGIDKQIVGQTAAEIRAMKKPEPYKGKGIRYQGEVIRRKVGKTAKATKGGKK